MSTYYVSNSAKLIVFGNKYVADFSTGEGYVTAYQTVYDSFTTKPSTATASYQNNLVKSLVDNGIWNLLDAFYVFAQETNNNKEALVNWKNPGTYDASTVNNPTFTSLEGFTGNNTSKATIYTAFNPRTASSPNYSLNSCSVGGYSRTSISQNAFLFGANDGTTSCGVLPLYTDNATIYANCNTSGNNSTSNTTTQGFFILSRLLSNNYKVYVNGTQTINTNTTAIAVPNAVFFGLGRTASTSNTNQLAVLFIGAGLSATQVTDMTNAVETYMDAINKGVIA